MDPIHIGCRGRVVNTGEAGWYCEHCRKYIEGYEVIKPAVKLVDAITIIKGLDYNTKYITNEMANLVINGMGSVKGPLWL